MGASTRLATAESFQPFRNCNLREGFFLAHNADTYALDAYSAIAVQRSGLIVRGFSPPNNSNEIQKPHHFRDK